jgi:hypothetical protein
METIYGNIKSIAEFLSIKDIINFALSNKTIKSRLESTLQSKKQSHLSRFAIDSEVELIAKQIVESFLSDNLNEKSKPTETKYGTFKISKFYWCSSIPEFFHDYCPIFQATCNVPKNCLFDWHNTNFKSKWSVCGLTKHIMALPEIKDYIGADISIVHICSVRAHRVEHDSFKYKLKYCASQTNNTHIMNTCKRFVALIRFIVHIMQMISSSKWKWT